MLDNRSATIGRLEPAAPEGAAPVLTDAMASGFGSGMKTRAYCPGCGEYRDIADGHETCLFCEYLEEKEARPAKRLPAGESKKRD